jgi:hypothetical protein
MTEDFHKVITDPCPNCGYEIHMHSNTKEDESGPAPNNLSLCYQCLTLIKFDNDLKLVKLTEDEYKQIPVETLSEVKLLIQQIQAKKNLNS